MPPSVICICIVPHTFDMTKSDAEVKLDIVARSVRHKWWPLTRPEHNKL